MCGPPFGTVDEDNLQETTTSDEIHPAASVRIPKANQPCTALRLFVSIRHLITYDVHYISAGQPLNVRFGPLNKAPLCGFARIS